MRIRTHLLTLRLLITISTFSFIRNRTMLQMLPQPLQLSAMFGHSTRIRSAFGRVVQHEEPLLSVFELVTVDDSATFTGVFGIFSAAASVANGVAHAVGGGCHAHGAAIGGGGAIIRDDVGVNVCNVYHFMRGYLSLVTAACAAAEAMAAASAATVSIHVAAAAVASIARSFPSLGRLGLLVDLIC